MKNIRGITLVSLVVTIIVLIILAGLSINLTLGENGIITMAKRARENMEFAKEDEERQLNELYMQMEQEGMSGEISYDAIAKLIEFKREIASTITELGIETSENADASTMSGNIRNLAGASSADKVSYDNTNSGLSTTNVQGAIDELNANLGNAITYDETTDYLGIYKNGEWIPILHAGLKNHRWFDRGVLNTRELGLPTFSFGACGTANSTTYTSDEYICISYSDGNGRDSAVITGQKIPVGKYSSITIDLSTVVTGTGVYLSLFNDKSYTKRVSNLQAITSSTNRTTYTLDLSDYNSTGTPLYFGVYADVSTAYIYEITFNT